MPDNESAPPEGTGTEAEEAAWEMATAETLRGRGELAEAATWYRRAANHLMEAGDFGSSSAENSRRGYTRPMRSGIV